MGVLNETQYNALRDQVKLGGSAADNALKQLSGNTVQYDKPAATPPSYMLANGGSQPTTSYVSPAANNTKPTTPVYNVTAPATSYTGSANQIGNVSGSTDLAKSYQDLYNSTRNSTNQNSQQNTWGDSKGNVYDTTTMTPQQIFALSLAKDSNPNASAILKGMGLDMNGNPTSPASQPTYSSSSSASTGGGTAQTQQASMTQPLYNGSSNAPGSGTGTIVPHYDVNSADFQNKSEADKKAIFQNDPSLAAQEVQRAKDVWAAKAGDPEAQRLAHEWADKVRSWAGLPADGANDVPATVGGGGGATTGSGTSDSNTLDWNDPKAVMQTLGQQISQTIGAMNDPKSSFWAGQKANSDLEQQGIFNTKISQYQNLLNSLKTGQQNDLKSLTDSIDGETNKIEDKSFQDWLNARQNAASRGLAGSGLAGDMNTRLLLAKQHDLADMFAGKNTAMNDINKRYSDQINTAQSGIASTNLNAMQSAAFQKLFQDGQGNLNDQFKTFADMFNNASKNNVTSEGDKLKAITDKYSTDVKYKYLYDKMDTDTKTKTAQLQLDWEKYGLDVTKVFGQDANGNPTLDAQKMVAEISQKAQQMAITQAHNAVTENQGWARINQTDQDMQIKLQAMENQTDQFKQRMNLDTSKANDAQLGKQVDTIKAIMTEEGSNLRSIRTKLDSKTLSAPDKASLTAEYAQSMSKIEAAQNSMGEIYKFKTGNAVKYSGDAPAPMDMTDMNYGDSTDSIG